MTEYTEPLKEITDVPEAMLYTVPPDNTMELIDSLINALLHADELIILQDKLLANEMDGIEADDSERDELSESFQHWQVLKHDIEKFSK